MELGKIIGVYQYVTFEGEAPIEEVPQTPTQEPVTVPETPIVEDPELVPTS